MTTRRTSTLTWLLVALLGSGCIASKRQALSQRVLRPCPNYAILPEDLRLAPRDLRVPVEGGELHAWHFLAEEPRATLLFAGGNAGNKATLLPFVEPLLERGYDVVLFDYRGFGLSRGAPGIETIESDAAAVFEAMLESERTGQVAVAGASLGSLVALSLAARFPEEVDAVFLESVFDPRRMIDRRYGRFGGFFARRVVGKVGKIASRCRELDQPIFIAHGAKDRLTPLSDARELAEACDEREASTELWIAEGAGHTPGLFARWGPAYIGRIVGFLDRSVGEEAPTIGYENRTSSSTYPETITRVISLHRALHRDRQEKERVEQVERELRAFSREELDLVWFRASRLFFALGNVLETHEEKERAKESYRQALSLIPEDHWRHVTYGDGGWSVGAWTTLERALDRLAVLESNPVWSVQRVDLRREREDRRESLCDFMKQRGSEHTCEDARRAPAYCNY